MLVPRLVLLASLALGAAGAASAQDQEAVAYGSLPPIQRDYRTKIASWSRAFFVDPTVMRGATISDPLLTRDSSGRLLWLVCLDVPNPATTPPPARTERHAFGFAPNYFTAPQERRGSSLTYETCDEHPLTWRPFRESARR